VLCVTIDNPSFNTISSTVHQGLKEAIETADADHGVKMILIVGADANLIADANIREFGQVPQPLSLPSA